MEPIYSAYYQAYVQKELCWVVTSTVRFPDHMSFDRCLDQEQSLFEFFVTPGLEDEFLQVMGSLEKAGIVHGLVKKPNRVQLEDGQSE